MREDLLGDIEVLVICVRAGADPCDSFVHERGRIRHRADDGHSRGESCLDLRSGNRGGDRQDRLLGAEQAADLAEEDVEVLWLDGDHDEPRAGHGLGVRERALDAVTLDDFLQSFLASSGHRDVARLAPAGAQEPGEQRLADAAGAQDRDLPIGSHAAV